MAGQLRAMTCNPDLADNLRLRAGSLSVLFARVPSRSRDLRVGEQSDPARRMPTCAVKILVRITH